MNLPNYPGIIGVANVTEDSETLTIELLPTETRIKIIALYKPQTTTNFSEN